MRLNRANSLLFAGLLYAGGLVVISVSPITEWRFIPEMPWEYLLRGWPKYWTSLDVLLNVLAYIPLGLLIGRAVSHRLSPMAWGPLQAFVFTVCASVLLSILLEAVQTYLPSRRPSVLDVLTNGAGASIGAFIASAYAQNKSRLQITDARPIEVGGLMLFGLWLLAQAAPQPIWLALGDIMTQTSEWRQGLTSFTGVDESPAVVQEIFAAQRILAEALCVATAILSCALLCHLSMLESPRWFSRYQPRHWLYTLILVVVITIGARASWILLLHSPEALLAWLGAGAQAGIVLALLSAYGLAGARPTLQRTAALVGIVVMLLLSNSLPQNDFANEAFTGWSKGAWLNLRGLANLAASAWPFLALGWFFIALTHRSTRALERDLFISRKPAN